MRNKLYARAALWLAAVLAAVSLSGCHGERKDALSDGNGAAQMAAPAAEITAEAPAAPETPESRTPEPTESVIPAAFTACSIRTARFETFRYWLYTPANPAENMPLIVYLHGGSGKGDDLEQITAVDGFPQYLRDGKLGDVRAYVLIPQLPDTEKSWLNAAAAISELIETTVSTYALDRNNISLTGHSMGGTGTWALACASPELFARIAPLSGSVRNAADTAEKLKNVPVRAFVGAADTIVPPDSSEETVAALKAAGDDAEITVFTGADHFTVPSLTFLDESIGLVDWLICG